MKNISIIIFILIFSFSAFGQDSKCPKIEVSGPSGTVQPGETMTFTVNVGVNDLSKIEYQWSVDKGTIIEGQGTPIISIETTGLVEATITATAKIKNLPQGCSDSVSETGVVVPLCILPIALDEFGKLSKNDEKARLDNLAVEIAAKEEFIAYIIIYHPLKKGDKSYENRAARIRNYLVKDRGMAPEKVIITFGGDEPEERTRMFLLPSDATPPIP